MNVAEAQREGDKERNKVCLSDSEGLQHVNRLMF